MTELPRAFTLKELSDHYGWSVDSLYDYVKSGQLVAAKVGKSYYVTAGAVADFLARRTVAVVDG